MFRQLMGYLFCSIILSLCLLPAFSSSSSCKLIVAADEYAFSMNLRVPQVQKNTTSEGFRKFQPQKINGTMYINWLKNGGYTVTFKGLKNLTFKVGDKNVTYKATVSDPLIAWIGNNKTNKFKTPCIELSVLAEPSYAIGTPGEDNSFILILSGEGTSELIDRGTRVAKSFKGNVAGQQGCSCSDYGHKSPTRSADQYGPTDEVIDVAPTYGTWKATFKHRINYFY